MAYKFKQDFAKFRDKLEKFVSRRAIHEHLVAAEKATAGSTNVGAQGGIIAAVISAAKNRIGPGNKPYADYSASYKKQLSLERKGGAFGTATGSAGRKDWLTVTGAMLNSGNFHWELDGDRLFLAYDSGDEELNTIARTHQEGTSTAGRSHTVKIPARPWLHFDTTLTVSAALSAYRRTLKQMAAKFNIGMLR